jgi:hypothetical protein
MEPMTEPAPIHDHALNNLRYIRDAMERATSFTSLPGWGGVAVGITAIVTAVLAGREGPTRTWMLIWLGEAVLAAAIALVTMVRKAARSQVSFRGAPARRFFVSYFAPIVAGAVLTIFLAQHGYYTVLPAAWLLIYGAATVSSGAYSIPVVPVMGVCYMLLGITAGFVPFAAGNILLGVGFGGLHVVFGWVIARRYGG